MIIRSQDKKRITADLNLSIAHIQGIFEILNGSRNTIGEYSTEEKAIKVLDMIQDVYVNANNGYGYIENTVFQMPQDSEVE